MDEQKQSELMREMQMITFERGPYAIPVFPDFIDAHSKKIKGLHQSVILGLGYYNFADVHVAA